jgi:diguanylate cyclase (GGDEF)-like protein/PAS domain S-box-containing protein
VSSRVPGLDAARPILDAIAQPVLVTDSQSLIIYWNPAATAVYGYAADEALGKSAGELLSQPEDAAALAIGVQELALGHPWTGEFRSRTRDGELLALIVTMTPLIEEDGSSLATIATAIDVTAAVADRQQLVEALALVEHQALHDHLTGLPNRALILDRAEQMLARARRQQSAVAALFVDLDDFKDINDGFGHAVGDQLLQAVTERFSDLLRESDTVGRLGGDEFVVITELAFSEGGAELVAERLLHVLREPFVLGTKESGMTSQLVTASIGIAEGDRATADELLRDADVALYRAKAAGKNRFQLFASEMHDAVHGRLVLEADLQLALAEGQFFLQYQPTFSLHDIATVGVEALIRWQHPIRGVVAPMEFISQLEHNGLILPVGRWVIEEARRQGAAWHQEGLPLTIAVNVSAQQLESGTFVAEVAEALAVSGLPPTALVIEITESDLMRDAETTIQRLVALKATGVRIAIDDFGTGYSSLAYLRQFPIDILKIDRSFVANMTESSEGDTLLSTLIQLGKQLGLHTVAEGIETDAQLHRLQDQDCDTGQGFLIARPMSPDAIAGFIRSRRLVPAGS